MNCKGKSIFSPSLYRSPKKNQVHSYRMVKAQCKAVLSELKKQTAWSAHWMMLRFWEPHVRCRVARVGNIFCDPHSLQSMNRNWKLYCCRHFAAYHFVKLFFETGCGRGFMIHEPWFMGAIELAFSWVRHHHCTSTLRWNMVENKWLHYGRRFLGFQIYIYGSR